jgi:REP-associated tyrosine transposase
MLGLGDQQAIERIAVTIRQRPHRQDVRDRNGQGEEAVDGHRLWQIKSPVGREAFRYLQTHAPEWLTRLTVCRDDGREERRFWQVGGGYDRNIVDESTALKVIDYIHLNPVRRGLVERPEDWEWSSARWYAGLRPVPLMIDQTLPQTYET